MDKTGDYQKCSNPECGHPRYRHERIVRQEDGRRMFVGCAVNWRPAGHKNFRKVCRCDAFQEKS